MPYQQALGAYGLQLMGEAFDHAGARQLALEGASRVLEDAWTKDDATGAWKHWEVLGMRGDRSPQPPDQYVEGKGAHSTPPFRAAWLPLALWVVLRHDPGNSRAREIYDVLRSEVLGGAGTLDWMPPVDRPVAPRLPVTASA
jgi:hypothetical protein